MTSANLLVTDAHFVWSDHLPTSQMIKMFSVGKRPTWSIVKS